MDTLLSQAQLLAKQRQIFFNEARPSSRNFGIHPRLLKAAHGMKMPGDFKSGPIGSTINKFNFVFSQDKAENEAKMLELCSKVLNDYNFEILETEKLEKSEEDWFDKPIFAFKCRAGHFELNIDFSEDPDCIPGILSVRQIVEIETGKTFSVNTDLFGQGGSEICTANLLACLKCSLVEEYRQSRFGHFVPLEDRLKEFYQVENIGTFTRYKPEFSTYEKSSGTHFDPQSIHVNDHAYHFILKITRQSDNRQCYLAPYPDGKTYKLLVTQTVDKIKLQSTYVGNAFDNEDSIDVNLINLWLRKISLIRDYSAQTPISEVVSLIEEFFSYEDGTFGTFENGVWYNTISVEKLINNVQKELKGTAIGIETDDSFRDSHWHADDFQRRFETSFKIHINDGWKDLAPNIPKLSVFYPFWYYKVLLTFRKDRCEMIIEGRCNNTDVRLEFDEKVSQASSQDKIKTQSFPIGTYKTVNRFSVVWNEIQSFIQELVKLNPVRSD